LEHTIIGSSVWTHDQAFLPYPAYKAAPTRLVSLTKVDIVVGPIDHLPLYGLGER
jgi:hypothetical protein